MTSLLARLGQLETRTALGTIWRPKKRRREEWICRRCQGRGVQRRGYGDESFRGTVSDYIFPPAREERRDGGGGPRDGRESGGRLRGTPQLTRRNPFAEEMEPEDREEMERENYMSLDAPDAPTGNDPQWPTRTTRGVDSTAPHESAQNMLWERFEDADEEGAQLAAEAETSASEDARDFLHESARDASLLNIDYATSLPQALARGETDLTARCMFAAAKADDMDFIRGLPDRVFTQVLTVLGPANVTSRFTMANLEMNETTRNLVGIAPMDRVAAEYSQLVSDIVAMRRSRGFRLSVSDYAVLLRGARDLGNRKLSESLWRRMQHDSCVPTTECYNYYMAARVFHEYHSSAGNHKLRVIPHNMSARTTSNPNAAYRTFRIGTGGLNEQVMAIFREMLSNGATADEESFRIVITAAAREGDMVSVKSVLRKVWNLDVDAVLGGGPEADTALKQLPIDSPLFPTDKLLSTIAHAFAINNDIPAALRLVDMVARHYDITISEETWAQLFEWTSVLASPRTGVKAASDGTKTGQLPLQSVMSLWQTMTAAPYHIQPTMGMYDHLIKNLFYRGMTPTIIEKMEQGRLIFYRSMDDAWQRWRQLKHGITRHQRGESLEQSLESLRREWEYAELRRKRNRLWCQRWLRLLLGSSQGPSRFVDADSIFHSDFPRLLWSWRYFAPRTVFYETATGTVELLMWNEEAIDRWKEKREDLMTERETWLREVPMYVGNEWLTSRRVPGDKRMPAESGEDLTAGDDPVKQDWAQPKRDERVEVQPDELDDQGQRAYHARFGGTVREARFSR
ncbi:hypothetical protein LTR35_015949 [Friedmanniomyces endolithicus]|nr:hypothetical protein LTR35_015949 [Friedmanniomyces endolithicus]KAK0273564.1 hypothetical protein LTS00_015765 [Friedmanniomyces endolithicus]KAK1001154.1 hypothetical protein LTR54_008666 [Friedmanniomyces endolithicus]